MERILKPDKTAPNKKSKQKMSLEISHDTTRYALHYGEDTFEACMSSHWYRAN